MGSSHEPALADGRAAARVEDSLRALGSPLPASRGVRTGAPVPPAPRWRHLRRGCRLRTRLQRSLVSWTRAGHSGGMRLRRGAASAAPARGVRRRGRFPARTFPDSRPAAPRRPGRPARWARISGCETGPDPQPECERAVSSGRRQWARSGGGCIFERGRAASSPGGALGGWPRQPEPRQTSKSPTDCWATWRGGDRAARRAWNGTTARLRQAGALKAICGQCQRLPTRIAASS